MYVSKGFVCKLQACIISYKSHTNCRDNHRQEHRCGKLPIKPNNDKNSNHYRWLRKVKCKEWKYVKWKIKGINKKLLVTLKSNNPTSSDAMTSNTLVVFNFLITHTLTLLRFWRRRIRLLSSVLWRPVELLKMLAARYFESLISTYQTTWYPNMRIYVIHIHNPQI
jgi:hypothetical protein